MDGEKHRLHRRVMAPAFNHTHVEKHHHAMVASTEAMMAGWREGDTRDIERDARGLVQTIAMRTVLGYTSGEEADNMRRAVTCLVETAPRAMMFPVGLPGTSWSRMTAAAREIAAILRRAVAEARSAGHDEDAALGAIIRSMEVCGVSLPDNELVAEAYNVMCHESTASAIAWAIFLLAQHPDNMAAAGEEIASVLHGGQPTRENLMRLPLLEQAIKETLRLFPTAPFARRVAAADSPLGDKEIPAGAGGIVSQYITQRIPDLFPEPARFHPSRWETIRPGNYEYFPFGAGVHNCIGGTFAMNELKVVLAMLLQKYRFMLPDNARIDRRYELSLRPKKRIASDSGWNGSPRQKGHCHR